MKRGLSRYSARNLPPVKARQMIEDGARQAVAGRKWPRPYVPAKPTTITVDLSTVDSADQFQGRPGVEIVEPLKVVSRGRTGCRRGTRFGTGERCRQRAPR